MTSLVKNAFNKVILDYFNSVDRWWEPISSPEDFNSMQDLTLITLGGFGNLPTVMAWLGGANRIFISLAFLLVAGILIWWFRTRATTGSRKARESGVEPGQNRDREGRE